MILINLLPPEYRQRRRTPAKFMVGIAAAVAVNCTLVAWWAWTAFGVAAEVQSEMALLGDQKAGLDPQVAYHNDLQAESGLMRSREDTLVSITGRRVSWTRKVDELIDVVSRGGDGDGYLIWLDDLKVDQKENQRRKTYGQFIAQGHSGGADFAKVANFLDDLEASPFVTDFSPPAPPQGQQNTVDEDLMPAEVWSFPLELSLLAPDQRRRPE
jgi:hypothetical protein